MSNQFNSLSSPLNNEIVQSIEELQLPIIQKHHIRLLAHCLAVLQDLIDEDYGAFTEGKRLQEWCKNQSQKFEDENFNELLFIQMSSASKKLNLYAKSIDKTILELDLQDLIALTQKNNQE